MFTSIDLIVSSNNSKHFWSLLFLKILNFVCSFLPSFLSCLVTSELQKRNGLVRLHWWSAWTMCFKALGHLMFLEFLEFAWNIEATEDYVRKERDRAKKKKNFRSKFVLGSSTEDNPRNNKKEKKKSKWQVRRCVWLELRASSPLGLWNCFWNVATPFEAQFATQVGSDVVTLLSLPLLTSIQCLHPFVIWVFLGRNLRCWWWWWWSVRTDICLSLLVWFGCLDPVFFFLEIFCHFSTKKLGNFWNILFL